jgi:hypothetical protein
LALFTKNVNGENPVFAPFFPRSNTGKTPLIKWRKFSIAQTAIKLVQLLIKGNRETVDGGYEMLFGGGWGEIGNGSVS